MGNLSRLNNWRTVYCYKLYLLQFVIISSFFRCLRFLKGNSRIQCWTTVEKSFIHVRMLSFFTAILISIIFIFLSKNIINLITDLDILRFYLINILFGCNHSTNNLFLLSIRRNIHRVTQTKEMRNTMIISVAIYLILSIKLTNIFGNMEYGYLFYYLWF